MNTPVQMIEVTSSNIVQIGYDSLDSRLYVKFKDDGKRVYQYSGVPSIVFLGLKECQSKGRYLQTQIIPYFLCQRVTDADLVATRSSDATSTPRRRNLVTG